MSYEDENDTMNGSVQDDDPDSTFNILLATDIHLGFMEKHPVRGKLCFLRETLKQKHTFSVLRFRRRQFCNV